MNDGVFSKQSALNAGIIPASPEELSQRYLKLFQQYSRLKAKHAILKKAVLEEQASNVTLQGNVKEKEKELRKLQEQLDLLAFHNERLTKRIQAVQENEQKGSHFSLLGSSVKKELEKNARALEEANLDLERKIIENEKLHEELSERQFEFTDNINNLLKQIQELEKRIKELQEENSSLKAESKTLITSEPMDTIIHEEEYDKLLKELELSKLELKKKTSILEEKEKMIEKNDLQLLSEIQSLRAILLAKVGNLKNKEETSLYSVIEPTSKALKELEDQARQYMQSLDGNTNDLKELPSEIAKKLSISTETYSKELLNLLKQLEDTKTELNSLLVEKDEQLVKEEAKNQEYEEKIQEQTKKINDLNLNNSYFLKKLNTEQALQELKDTKETYNKRKMFDKETQVGLDVKDEEEDTTFVYPIEEKSIRIENTDKKVDRKEEEEEEEEDVFVYRGRDAVIVENNEDDISIREEKLKLYYEQKLKNLTDKIQMTDSKAVRFAEMYKSLKERLVKEDKEKERMTSEIERLNKEVKNVKDMLTTTEINYQKQVDTMTEFITSLQQNQ
ncbi:uncharacterized protein BX663DRAFT_486539 [Cokeromyces recurvatus]|uniref:uncharacterized protein n=1 Tax=Cokeromyces recurvatus TaxID=90255 RepID=UPI002221006A|nr:uncharacterized protein BX663DRAFT_486539 [Cokeromyces recurvatus]KAI7902735.1 hypothetical protein BX663DRAFT_486539 [Cokeromyces recurvatus]